MYCKEFAFPYSSRIENFYSKEPPCNQSFESLTKWLMDDCMGNWKRRLIFSKSLPLLLTCLKDSAMNIHCHHSFVNRRTPKRYGLSPCPHTHLWCDDRNCPLGSRAGLSLHSWCVYNEWWCCQPLKRAEATVLFLSYQFHLCGGFVLGGWIVWWAFGCLPLQGPFSSLDRYKLPPGSGNFLFPGKGTGVGVLGSTESRFGSILLPFFFPPKRMTFF